MRISQHTLKLPKWEMGERCFLGEQEVSLELPVCCPLQPWNLDELGWASSDTAPHWKRKTATCLHKQSSLLPCARSCYLGKSSSWIRDIWAVESLALTVYLPQLLLGWSQCLRYHVTLFLSNPSHNSLVHQGQLEVKRRAGRKREGKEEAY